ncbi:polyamine aminopropyltransferase [Planctomycetota bacterium]|nr:polyamine aminopropyltransferase [Planctomycetota bacterium]
MARYVIERLNPTFGYFYQAGKTLQRGKTQYQDLEICESEEFGNVLLLDGVTQVTSKNEFLYHEPMVHPALTSHPDPKDVLIIGAGDGGILREVLKHRTVRKAVMAELDGGVIDFCAQHMPEINAGAFADRRYRPEVGDGRRFVEKTQETFDCVIMDMTDPFGPSAMLYTREFFQHIKRTFTDERGIFVMHTESPISRPRTFQQCLRTLGDVFKYRRTFYLYIHMYAVLWSVTVSSDTIDVGELSAEEIGVRLNARGVSGLHCYNGATHRSMQVPMPFIQELVDGAPSLPAITDASPKVLDDIDINRGSIEIREG